MHGSLMCVRWISCALIRGEALFVPNTHCFIFLKVNRCMKMIHKNKFLSFAPINDHASIADDFSRGKTRPMKTGANVFSKTCKTNHQTIRHFVNLFSAGHE